MEDLCFVIALNRKWACTLYDLAWHSFVPAFNFVWVTEMKSEENFRVLEFEYIFPEPDSFESGFGSMYLHPKHCKILMKADLDLLGLPCQHYKDAQFLENARKKECRVPLSIVFYSPYICLIFL